MSRITGGWQTGIISDARVPDSMERRQERKQRRTETRARIVQIVGTELDFASVEYPHTDVAKESGLNQQVGAHSGFGQENASNLFTMSVNSARKPSGTPRLGSSR